MENKEDWKTTDWQNLPKKEKRKLAKKQKRLDFEQKTKKNRLLKWGFAFGTMAILTGSFFLFKNFNQKRYKDTPKIQVLPKTFNFDKVLASKGVINTDFEVKNVGVSPLIISGMVSSCGCTTAILKINGEESPRFGMHNNPTNWSTSIEPGAKTELWITFDPNFHKNTFGPVTRTVSVFSNDPGKREAKVTIYANVQR